MSNGLWRLNLLCQRKRDKKKNKHPYFILDDTIWQRFSKKAEAVSFVWDSSIGKAVFGMSVVLLIWTDDKRKVPLEIRVWKKTAANRKSSWRQDSSDKRISER